MMEGNATNTHTRPGFGRRLGRSLYRILRAFIIVMVILAVLVGVAWGGLWLYQVVSGEINRSAESVATRFAAQESRIDILRREVDTLLSANPGQDQRLNELDVRFSDLDTRLDNLATDMNRQSQMLDSLDASMAVTLDNDAAAAQNITDLGAALTTLQADFNTSTGQIDALGGEIDAFTGEVGQVQTGLTTVEATAVAAADLANESQTTVSDMVYSLALFRAWELVARARLRLLENNYGLAAADVNAAMGTVTAVLNTLPAESDEAVDLSIIQTRLTLAAASLPGNPSQAAADLESVWDGLDDILVARLQPATVQPEQAAATATPGG
ncbi:MAG: hypothetical protein H6659_04160 [Ardenticatenaceae bacterium]|nr:hypothetical protein [Ardenticatenaceae bacterium]MCB8986449.1 hypothetical protein [Ardenticatenaceae bacterium]